MSLALGAMFGGDEDAYEEAGFSEEQGWVAQPSADPVLRLRIDSLAATLEDTAPGSDEQVEMSRVLLALRNEMEVAETSRARAQRHAAEAARVQSLSVAERDAEAAETERLSRQDMFAGEGGGELVYMAGDPVHVYQTGWRA